VALAASAGDRQRPGVDPVRPLHMRTGSAPTSGPEKTAASRCATTMSYVTGSARSRSAARPSSGGPSRSNATGSQRTSASRPSCRTAQAARFCRRPPSRIARKGERAVIRAGCWRLWWPQS
jgi:hypothetical protein